MIITMAASVSVSQAISDITKLKTEIKWPNDILLKNKKVCGILTELGADSNKINYAIVGIGINVNNDINGELNEKAISLKQEFDSNISRVDLLRSFLEYFDSNYDQLKNKNFDYVKRIWLSLTNTIGRRIIVKEEKTETKGIVRDIDDNGYLILETSSGVKKINFGDVFYL